MNTFSEYIYEFYLKKIKKDNPYLPERLVKQLAEIECQKAADRFLAEILKERL